MLVDDMPEDVAAELADPEFLHLTHHSKGTYSKGCHGPLCRLRNRDRMRLITEKRAVEAGRTYRPMYNLRDTLVPDNRDELLYKIAMLHRIERHALKKSA